MVKKTWYSLNPKLLSFMCVCWIQRMRKLHLTWLSEAEWKWKLYFCLHVYYLESSVLSAVWLMILDDFHLLHSLHINSNDVSKSQICSIVDVFHIFSLILGLQMTLLPVQPTLCCAVFYDITPSDVLTVPHVFPGSSLSPPVLTVFPPSTADLQSNKATLVCLSSQSGPFADVSWLAAGSPVSSGISTTAAVQQPDQTFQLSSYLSVQTSDWNMDKVYTCKVSLGSQTSEKTIKKSDCPTGE